MPKLEEVVWGETQGLTARPGSDAALTRLYAVVAKMAQIAQERGLSSHMKRAVLIQSRASPEERARYDVMERMAAEVAAGFWASDPSLPRRAAIWELNPDGSLRMEPGQPDAAMRWVSDTGTRSGGDFVAADGRNFRLLEFEQDINPKELPFVSAYTRTSLPRATAKTRRQRALAWTLGLVGGLGFILVALNLSFAASGFSEAYRLLMGRHTSHNAGFAQAVVLPPCSVAGSTLCETDVMRLAMDGRAREGTDLARAIEARKALVMAQGAPCVDGLVAQARALRTTPNNATSIDLRCLDLAGQAVFYASRHLVVTAETGLGSAFQFVSWWMRGWLVPDHGAQPISLVLAITLMMAGAVLLLIGLGLGVQGKPLGALISPENRYSLALAQVTFWTILVLTSVIAIAAFNSGLVGEQMRYYAHLQVTAASPEAMRNGFFPIMPQAMWAVLGITFVTPVLSSLLKGLRPAPAADMPEFTVAGVDAAGSATAGKSVVGFTVPLAAHGDAREASIADWFLGEDDNTKDRIDISRLQMVMITVGLIVTYGQAIFALVRSLPTYDILMTVREAAVLVPSLPVVGATMTLMLAASHATYLGAKAFETRPAPPNR